MYKAGTILLVENNCDDARLVELAFEKAKVNHALAIVSDGLEAINYLKGSGKYADRKKFPLPKLILLDLAIPGLDGFEVLKLVRHEKQLKDLPVTVFSGSECLRDTNRAYQLGANSFLVKPSDFLKFTSAIKETVDFWLGSDTLPHAPVYLQMPQECSLVAYVDKE
jgi:CheY-like chemotaxis protein